MSLYEAVLDLLGTPPAGYEIVVYVLCFVMLLYLVTCAFSIIAALLNYIGGK